ncbi:MAG: YjdF family protein [Clostridia bacterium]|nr:YjdF family protein [Clostridia bacterium]
MCKVSSSLTIFFEDPFWVAVYERISDGKLEVSGVVFGAQPKDSKVYDYFLKNWHRLQFSPPVELNRSQEGIINPKRMQRAINRQLSQPGIGTKAQQAFKMQQEQNKLEHNFLCRQRSEEEKQRQFELRQQKRREKHKGR